MNEIKLTQIFELSITELIQIAFESASALPPLEKLYLGVMTCFHKGDIDTLETLGKESLILLTEDKCPEWMPHLIYSRMTIVRRNCHVKDAKDLIRYSQTETLWSGELLMVAAHILETLEHLQDARETYLMASKKLSKVGCEKKALKAFMNSIVMSSQIDPGRVFMSEYLGIYRIAKKLKEYTCAGISLHNVSREYRNAGALSVALIYANQALKYLHKNPGSLQYYMALTNRCDLLFEMGRTPEALIDYEMATVAPFKEIKAALLLIQKRFLNSAHHEIPRQDLVSIWEERSNEDPNRPTRVLIGTGRSVELQDSLLQFLGLQPRSKHELIEYLYGKTVEIHFAEARLKSLLTRLRKKSPGLIFLENGKYRIGDRIEVARKSAASK